MLTEAEPPEAMRMLRAGQVDVALVVPALQDGTRSGRPPDAEGRQDQAAARRAGPPGHQAAAGPAPPGQPGGSQPGSGQPTAAASGPTWPPTRTARGSLAASAAAALLSALRACRASAPKIAFTTDDHVAVQALVAAGLGVTTLPGLALRAARHPGIRAQPLPGARRHVFAMTYGEPPDPPAVDHLLDILALAASATANGPGSGFPRTAGPPRAAS